MPGNDGCAVKCWIKLLLAYWVETAKLFWIRPSSNESEFQYIQI